MPTRQDVAIGLSLSTLWFIGVWSDLLPFLYLSSRFPVGALPCWQDFLGVVLNVCLLGGVFAVGRALVRRAPQPVQTAAGWIFLVSLVVPLNVIRNHFHTHVEPLFSTIGPLAARTVLFLIVIGAATVIVRWRRRMVHAISTGLLILFPLVPLLFAQAAWAMSQAHGRMQCAGASTFAAALEGAPRARVIWIVYDELEEYAAFEGRPPDLALPELDRLRMESIAAAPLAPGDRTERSMPAFLVGAPVDDSMLTSRNELKLTVRGRPDVTPLTPGDTVFARARALGMNAGVAGFFLPYCSLVGPVVTTCSWQPCVTCGRMVGAFGSSVGESMANQVSELAPRYGVRRHLAGYRALAGRGARASSGSLAGICVDPPARAACAAHLRSAYRSFQPHGFRRVGVSRQPRSRGSVAWRAAPVHGSQRQLDGDDGHPFRGSRPPLARGWRQRRSPGSAIFPEACGIVSRPDLRQAFQRGPRPRPHARAIGRPPRDARRRSRLAGR